MERAIAHPKTTLAVQTDWDFVAKESNFLIIIF